RASAFNPAWRRGGPDVERGGAAVDPARRRAARLGLDHRWALEGTGRGLQPRAGLRGDRAGRLLPHRVVLRERLQARARALRRPPALAVTSERGLGPSRPGHTQRELEARHGSAAARPSARGAWGPFEAPHVVSIKTPRRSRGARPASA